MAAGIIAGIIPNTNYFTNLPSSKAVSLAPNQEYKITTFIETNPSYGLDVSVDICSTPSNIPLFVRLQSDNGTILMNQTVARTPLHTYFNNTNSAFFTLSLKDVGAEPVAINALLRQGLHNPPPNSPYSGLEGELPPPTCSVPLPP
jgi:hypothetical protein